MDNENEVISETEPTEKEESLIKKHFPNIPVSVEREMLKYVEGLVIEKHFSVYAYEFNLKLKKELARVLYGNSKNKNFYGFETSVVNDSDFWKVMKRECDKLVHDESSINLRVFIKAFFNANNNQDGYTILGELLNNA